MEINIGNIVRLNYTYEIKEGNHWVQVDHRVPLKVKSKDYHDDKEYCTVAGNGFKLGIECDQLIKVKEYGKVNTKFIE